MPRDWLEDLVVNETVKYVLQPEQIQLEDRQKDAEVTYLEKQLAEKKKAIANTIKAIESGVSTKALPQRLKELDDEQENLETIVRYHGKDTDTAICKAALEEIKAFGYFPILYTYTNFARLPDMVQKKLQ